MNVARTPTARRSTTAPRRRPRRLVAAAFAALLAAGCGGGGSTGGGLPDVELVALDGGATSNLADLRGPAVVNLWATWCAPCRREMPDFESVHRARGDEVRFVGVNVGEDGDRARDFIAEIGVTYDQFLDSDGAVATALETTAMPVTLVVDRDGTIATRHLGPMSQDELDDAIDAVLAG